jgi:sphinganine C4-monooxygenase
MEAFTAGAARLVQHCTTVASTRLTLHSVELWVSLAPVVFYWAVAGFFELLDALQLPATERYRIHSAADAAKRNQVGRLHVAWRVLLQHAIQVAVGAAMTLVDPGFCDSKPWRGLARGVADFVLAMLVMDAWQYAIHRAMHESKALYNAVHSHHHRMVVCYAYGALYNHPLEALLLDTIGGVVTFYASGISCAGGLAFFTFSTVKTVLDHSGYTFPVNLLHDVLPNNAAYHDVHHDPRGFRRNYSQPFFTHWDRLLGTHMHPDELCASGRAAAKVAAPAAPSVAPGQSQQTHQQQPDAAGAAAQELHGLRPRKRPQHA